MTGLLIGTNKFKNFEIETNQKVSVLNSPYLEGRKYVYGDTNSSSVPSNYKIYDSAEWYKTDKPKVNLEEGFYVIASYQKNTNVGLICKLSKQNDGAFSLKHVCSKVDSSTNEPTEMQILIDYTNPNSIKNISTGTPPLDINMPEFAQLECPTAISDITDIVCYENNFDFIVEQNPNLIGCIITRFYDGGGLA